MIKAMKTLPEEGTVVISFGTEAELLPWLKGIDIESSVDSIWINTVTEEELEWGEKGELDLQLEQVDHYDELVFEHDNYNMLGEFILYKGPAQAYQGENERLSHIGYELISEPLDEPGNNCRFAIPTENEYVIVKVWRSLDRKSVISKFYTIPPVSRIFEQPINKFPVKIFLQEEENLFKTKQTEKDTVLGPSYFAWDITPQTDPIIKMVDTEEEFRIVKHGPQTQEMFFHNPNGGTIRIDTPTHTYDLYPTKEWVTLRLEIDNNLFWIDWYETD